MLELRKKGNKHWLLIDEEIGEFTPSKFTINRLNSKIEVVYFNNLKSKNYDVSDCYIFDIDETIGFNTSSGVEFMDKLEELNCPCFQKDETIVINTPVDISGKLNKVSTAGVERAYIINADGSQGVKETSKFKDVLEFANLASFPATGESGKIYLAIDTNLTYRWGGSSYVVMSSSLALGETSSTAYRGDRGKIAYDHSQTIGNPHGTTKNDIGLGNVDNTSDIDKPISTATQSALDLKLDKSTTPSSVYATDASGNQEMISKSDFQNTLVSGTTIKTIEGQSILGSGNIDLTKSDIGLSDVHNLDTSTTSNITDSTNKRFVTEEEKAAITHSNRSILDAITESFTTALKTAYDNTVTWISTNGTNILNHIYSTSNPHNVTKTQVGLSNVDNTSDLNKPISTATQTTLDLKENAANKATDLSSPDNTKYPTTLAVANETKKATITVELISQLTTNFYAPSALRINSKELISGSGTLSLKVNDVAYTLTDLIPQGAKITTETTSSSVYNLISIYE